MKRRRSWKVRRKVCMPRRTALDFGKVVGFPHLKFGFALSIGSDRSNWVLTGARYTEQVFIGFDLATGPDMAGWAMWDGDRWLLGVAQ